jgi:hypothetical protein
MKRLITSPDSAELGLLKNMLDKAGIQCVERNEQLAQTIPSAPFHAELWVENDADYQAAADLLADWQHPASAARESWVCPRCGELREGQFSKCWKCGTKRPANE